MLGTASKIRMYLSDILSWTPTHGHTSVGCPSMTYIHHVCVDTGYSSENLPRGMADRNRWWERERVKELCAIYITYDNE